MTRDKARARVYAAEQQVRSAIARANTAGQVDFFGSQLPVPAERRFGSLAEVSEYLEQALATVANEFGHLPVPTVRLRAGDAEAHYEFATATIALPAASDWAWRELVVLHELAHHITALTSANAAAHGAEFAAVYLRLVNQQLGATAELLLRAAFDGAGVEVGQ